MPVGCLAQQEGNDTGRGQDLCPQLQNAVGRRRCRSQDNGTRAPGGRGPRAHIALLLS